MKLPRFRYTQLRTRMAVLYAGLFVLGFVVVAIVAQAMVESQARRSVTAELLTSGTVNDRIWALRERSLIGSADVLARDFGFRSAIASGDQPTILSALETLKSRANVPIAAVVTQVVGMGSGVTAARLWCYGLHVRTRIGSQN